MKQHSIAEVREYVARAELPAAPEGGLEDVQALAFDQAKPQSLVVGSDIISFVQGVTAEQRQDILNSSLLAQLVAKKKVPDSTDILAWYDAYFDVLSNIGWVIQDQAFSTFSEEAQNFQAHEAVIKVATALLGPAATSLALVTATLDALRSMSQDSPWITLFNRESQSAHTARFQVTLAERSPEGDFLVTLMAFGLEASTNLTQVLFFKFRKSEATLKHRSGKVTINALALASVRDAIAQKISVFTNDFVRALPDL